MAFMQSYQKIAIKLFNNFVEPRLDQFKSIHQDIKMANLSIMFREYISICFFTAVVAALVSFPVSAVILLLLKKTMAEVILLTIIIGSASTVGMFLAALKYPAMRANSRKRDIDNNLPFAVLYMNTIAGTGAPTSAIFKLLSNFKEYGELSNEAQEIVQDVEVMGQDIEVALERAAERSPSENFKDLLWGMITTTVRGGNLKSLLQEKSKYLMQDYRRRMDQYTNDLNLYVEVYITLVIVGSIFSIVMLTIMGAISGFAELKAIQEMLVYIFLPMSAIVFIVLLKITSPIS